MASTPEELSIQHRERGCEFRVSYRIDRDPAALWAMLTEPDRLAEWLAPGRVDPWPGGRARIDFQESGIPIDSVVCAAEPPYLLKYSWSAGDGAERPLRWEITPVGHGARLTLTVRLPDGEDAAKACAGWDAHLQMLLAALEGVPIRFPVDHFLATRQRCQAALAE